VIGVGDELLLGHTVNTNGSWIANELSSLGLEVVGQEVVGDVIGAIRGAVARGLSVGDVVVMTGGLGPTPDDLTRSAVAEHFDLPLQEDPVLVEGLRARFRARGLGELLPNNRAMALVPRGATILPNPLGAAPGLVVPDPEGRMVILLPGIPGEMKGIFSREVGPHLRGLFRSRLRPLHHRMIYTTGIPESVLAQEIGALLRDDSGHVSLAFLPDLRGVRIRLTVRGLDREEAGTHLDRLESKLEGNLAPYRYWAEGGDLAEALGSTLMSVGGTLATAESCTGGLISKRITDIPGSSRYFLGGVVAYSDEVKIRDLGVSPEVLEENGSGSGPVAEGMALGVARRMGTTVGLGVTGVAGPGGGSDEKPVGTVFFGAAVEGKVRIRKERFLGDRNAVRERAAQAAMALVLGLLEGRPE